MWPTGEIHAFFGISRTLGSSREGNNHENAGREGGRGKEGKIHEMLGEEGGSGKRAARWKKNKICVKGSHAQCTPIHRKKN